MSQDIRNFFKRTPGKSSTGTIGSSLSDTKNNKRRYVMDSDSDDDFQPLKAKRITTDKGKTSKFDKSVSPKKKKTPTKHQEINKTTLQSLFGKEPVKRSGVPKKETKVVKRISDAFDDDDDVFTAAVSMIDDGTEEESFKDRSFASSGFYSQTSSLSQFSVSNSPPEKISPSNAKQSPANILKLDEHVASIKNSHSVKSYSENKPDKKNLSEAKAFNRSPVSIKGDCKQEKKTARPNLSPIKIRKVDGTKEIKFSPPQRVEPLISELWVDKYKPSSIKQIIGQQGEKSNVNKLLRWLRDWHINHSGTKKLTRPSPWAKDDSGAYFKAALLSGPPGVGKTTTAHLVCKELEMDSVEFNASDTRSKKLLNQEVGELLSNKSLSPFFTDSGSEVTKRHVLVMDEVDGMAGNEDRGGVQELIQLIKTSKIPVICMCNDRNHPKIRSLANYCFDLRFSKPRADQIKGAMLSVCFKEKLKIKPEVLMDIIINTNQDIRLILNHLSMLAASNNDKMKASTKDIKIGPWDVLRKVFSEEEHKKMSIHDKSDLFFYDYSIAPLFVQENYLMVVPHSLASKTKLGKMELFAKAAESIANGDLVEKAIRSCGAWSLLPTQAMFSSLIPGDLLEGHVGGQINFPLWLGKNSKKNKMDRLAQEIQSHTRLRLSGSKEDVGLDYAKALFDAIVRPLSQEGSEGTEKSLDVMREYSLLREDLDSLSQLSDWNFRPDPFARLESKVKAAFTRAYNKCSIMSPFAPVSAIKKKSKRVGDQDLDSDEEISEGTDEDDDDINKDTMIVVKKKSEKKAAAKTSADSGTSIISKRGGRGGKRGRK